MNLAEQRSAMARLQKLIDEGNAAVAAVDANLRPEVLAERVSKVRAEFGERLDTVLNEMSGRRSEAAAMLPLWTQEAARRRAKFTDDAAADAMIRLAKLQTLALTPTADLLGHLDDAIQGNNLALAELVRLEFFTRADRGKDVAANLPNKFEARFAVMVDPFAKERHAELQEVVQIPEMAIALMREFKTGRSDPMGRLQAAHLGSIGTPPAPREEIAA